MTDADFCRHHGWKAGTVLEAAANGHCFQIRITAVGEGLVLGRRITNDYGPDNFEGLVYEDAPEGTWLLQRCLWRQQGE